MVRLEVVAQPGERTWRTSESAVAMAPGDRTLQHDQHQKQPAQRLNPPANTGFLRSASR